MSNYFPRDVAAPFMWEPDDTLRTRIDKDIGLGRAFGIGTPREEAALEMLCDPDRDVAGEYDRARIVECFRGSGHYWDIEQNSWIRDHCFEIAEKIEKRERLT